MRRNSSKLQTKMKLFRLDSDVRKALSDEAKEQDASESAIVHEIFRDYFDLNAPRQRGKHHVEKSHPKTKRTIPNFLT